MHLRILLGGMPIALLGAGTWSLVLLVAAKTAVDLRAHRREHGAFGEG